MSAFRSTLAKQSCSGLEKVKPDKVAPILAFLRGGTRVESSNPPLSQSVPVPVPAVETAQTKLKVNKQQKKALAAAELRKKQKELKRKKQAEERRFVAISLLNSNANAF